MPDLRAMECGGNDAAFAGPRGAKAASQPPHSIIPAFQPSQGNVGQVPDGAFDMYPTRAPTARRIAGVYLRRSMV